MKNTMKHQNHHEHESHHEMMVEDFKRRFFVSLILTIPILFLSPIIQQFLGIRFTFTGDKYLLFIISGVVFFYGGWPFLKGIIEEIKKRQPGGSSAYRFGNQRRTAFIAVRLSLA